jgi:membrane associated rhomboid family serine protease
MFIILPVGVNYQTQRYPVVTFTLMGINVVIYLATLALGGFTDEEAQLWVFDHLWLTPNISWLHTYVTSMFVHEGFFHLLGNMIYLFLFGCCVEDVIGRWKFLVVYLLSGVIADLVFIAATAEHFASEIPLGGASGAVTACIAGFLVLFRKQEIEFRYFGFLFFRVFAGEFSLAAWIVISFWFAEDLLFAFLSFGSSGGGVAFAAHVGGFIAGLAMVGAYRMLQKNPPMEAVDQQWNPSMIRRTATALPPQATVDETPSIFLSDGGAESGPFTSQKVREMMALGSISAEAFYWQEGMADWSTVQDFSA